MFAADSDNKKSLSEPKTGKPTDENGTGSKITGGEA
jgi:hypothetical protein